MEAADSEGEKRPKRHMKTPQQRDALEKAYASEMYPSEERRAELSKELGLSDRQLQMWFCHRRLKDKKDKQDGSGGKKVSAKAVGKKGFADSTPNEMLAADGGSGHGSRSESGSGSGSSRFDYGDELPIARGYVESPVLRIEHVVACVEAQLGERLRDDGPILGTEFDELPPGAFGEPIEMAEKQTRSWHSFEGESYSPCNFRPTKVGMRDSCNYLLDEPRARSDAHRQHEPSFHNFADGSPSTSASVLLNGNGKMPRGLGVQGPVLCSKSLPQQGTQGHLPSLSRDNKCSGQSEVLTHMEIDPTDMLRPVIEPLISDLPAMFTPRSEHGMAVERKRKSDEVVVGSHIEAQEKRIRKELEKQDILKHKREEQMKREMEKQDRERRRDEERMLREKQRQQERFEREERREIERREKFLQKESMKAERMRQKEELRREKEEARNRAALEKATSRKLAKEYMELIEDERLELMELAALSKGLQSIVSLDYDSLQNLESFRALLQPFPPKTVQLRQPFAIKPWKDSDENIGNLLMVWRFCLTFADVLGLWPFTLDEFVQAFHEYDSRLMGEIHIAFLKLIIKDIEDVARTPSTTAGTNQCSAANPDGGHPRIVEGAYYWGFDILDWKYHLNPLTWPEVLRQFGLSAGFGPRLKKKSIELPNLPDKDEAKGCEDIISILRDGSAAQNAFAVMQEKGILLKRKSRHRLTPGTVKFAAYHVLCLEGSKGLTVIELAQKIQKSGLRDLTTSKTPEASISVALSRDTILFERTAPSTYRVRTPFRKDPADAESVLSAAREKMKRFESGFIAEENTDGVQREEDSDAEVSDSPEIDGFGTPDANKGSSSIDVISTFLGDEKQNLIDDLSEQQEFIDFSGSPIIKPMADDINNSMDDIAGDGGDANILNQGDTEIDESQSGESWVQGLTEGEYSELSVEERLNALVALVGISNEGNCIRSILEDRLDAANALKKQMWADAQLDKKRVKEETVTKFQFSFTGNVAEMDPIRDVPSAAVDNKTSELSLDTLVKEPSFGADNTQNCFHGVLPQRSVLVTDASEKSRLQMKSYISHRAEETYVYRSLPLGQDRRHNRYWQFVACSSRDDPGTGRIFVESPDGYWRLIDSEEAFDALIESLDTRGIRESHLYMILQKIEKSFKENVRTSSSLASNSSRDRKVGDEVFEMDCPVLTEDSPSSLVSGLNCSPIEISSSFRIQLGKGDSEKKDALNRYQEFEMWIWKECFNSTTLCAMRYERKRCAPLLGICEDCRNSYIVENNLCPSCHKPFGTFGNKSSNSQNGTHLYDEVKLYSNNVSDSCHPLRVRLLKALLTVVEATVPSRALLSSWTDNARKMWGKKLDASSSAENILQTLTEFEGEVNRNCLFSNFETTGELLSSAALSGKHNMCDSIGVAKSVPELPWIPQTTSAVALRFFEFDSSISYAPEQTTELDRLEAEHTTQLPLRFALIKTAEMMGQTRGDMSKPLKVKKSKYPSSVRGGSKYRQGVQGRPRGRPQKRVIKSVKQGVKDDELTLAQVLWQQEQTTQGQKLGRGRRTIRRPRVEKSNDEEMLLGHFRSVGRLSVSPKNFRGFSEGVENMQIDDVGNSISNSSEAIESDDDVTHGVENDQYVNLGMGNSREISDDDDDDEEEEEEEEDGGNENGGNEYDQYLNLGAGSSRDMGVDGDDDDKDENEFGEAGEENFGVNADENQDSGSDSDSDEGNELRDSEDYSD